MSLDNSVKPESLNPLHGIQDVGVINRLLPTRTIHFQGSRLAAQLLKWAGWQVRFEGLPGNLGVVLFYPHTSNWDFVVGVLAKWSIGIPLKFFGKDSLFRIPIFGSWLRYLGGIPVNRTNKSGMIDSTIKQILATPKEGLFWLALSPEGTRKKIPGWRSGFYRIACQANIPIGVAYLDYSKKTLDLQSFFMPTGDEKNDIALIALILQGLVGFKPENMSPIQLLDSSIKRDETLIVAKNINHDT